MLKLLYSLNIRSVGENSGDCECYWRRLTPQASKKFKVISATWVSTLSCWKKGFAYISKKGTRYGYKFSQILALSRYATVNVSWTHLNSIPYSFQGFPWSIPNVADGTVWSESAEDGNSMKTIQKSLFHDKLILAFRQAPSVIANCPGCGKSIFKGW